MTPYYSDAYATIYHANAGEIASELGKFDLLLTDPPYAIGSGKNEWAATASVAIALHETAKRIKPKGSAVAFTTTSGRGIEFTQGALRNRLPLNRLLTWRKLGGRSRAHSPWAWDSVAILLYGRAPETKVGDSSVFETSAEQEPDGEHPSELPPTLCEWLYRPFDLPDLTVLDPFMGTGRLLEPAYLRKRRVVGVDINERYCEIAAQRFQALSSSPTSE